jgi:hypothetical protein
MTTFLPLNFLTENVLISWYRLPSVFIHLSMRSFHLFLYVSSVRTFSLFPVSEFIHFCSIVHVQPHCLKFSFVPSLILFCLSHFMFVTQYNTKFSPVNKCGGHVDLHCGSYREEHLCFLGVFKKTKKQTVFISVLNGAEWENHCVYTHAVRMTCKDAVIISFEAPSEICLTDMKKIKRNPLIFCGLTEIRTGLFPLLTIMQWCSVRKVTEIRDIHKQNFLNSNRSLPVLQKNVLPSPWDRLSWRWRQQEPPNDYQTVSYNRIEFYTFYPSFSGLRHCIPFSLQSCYLSMALFNRVLKELMKDQPVFR